MLTKSTIKSENISIEKNKYNSPEMIFPVISSHISIVTYDFNCITNLIVVMFEAYPK